MFRKIFGTTLEKTILGRWERTTEKANSIKVYWANMDHCGTCGKELLHKQTHTRRGLTTDVNKLKAVQPDIKK